MKLTVIGLSITSSWGNGHATTWRALLAGLARRGHTITFLERNKPWYAANRDLPNPPYCRTLLYESVDELDTVWRDEIADADTVIIGSFVPEGVAVAEKVMRLAAGPVCFYDIDTPITVAKLKRGDHEYLASDLLPRFSIYWSFTGGPILDHLQQEWGTPRARALYCTVDEKAYQPLPSVRDLALGYLGTYSEDRQPALETLLLQPARARPAERFAVAGPQYPADISWPVNVERTDHLPPDAHPSFYSRQSFALNITRQDMIRAGHAPSVRLFEAAACGVPIISDRWPGIETFFTPGSEIHLADSTADILAILDETSEAARAEMAAAARKRVLTSHTADIRAAEFEADLQSL